MREKGRWRERECTQWRMTGWREGTRRSAAMSSKKEGR